MINQLSRTFLFRRLFSTSSILLFATLIAIPTQAETPGNDGPITVSSPNTILNEYGNVTGALSVGQTMIPVSDVAGDLPSLNSGDLIMIYQAQGATISSANSVSYGAVTSLNSAGRYEFHTVSSVSGNSIILEGYGGACVGLTYNYDFDRAQIIRVPQASTLSVLSGGSVAAQNWNGQTGGVIALHVEGALSLSGSLDVSEAGFRGGVVDNLTSPSGGPLPAEYVSSSATRGAEKGESVAGFQDDYPGGRYNRGAPANGGGGGNAHNSGGGGGANGNNGFTWTGQGNPDRSVSAWDAAWNLDPSLNATSLSSGGGRGGYTYSRNGNALTTAPGAAAWPNDKRREVGGLGGRPLTYEASGRIYFGGGGGAGDGNNFAASDGGAGGGLVFIIADSVVGSGSIRADGADADNTSPNHNDAPGGGGGGGTIVVKTESIGPIQISANGGDGGSQLITNTENEGPGGGGGGGVIAVAGGIPGATVTFGGANGTTSASSMTEFIPNGATQGAEGQPNLSAPSDAELPFCEVPPGQLAATKSVSVWDPANEGLYHLPGNDVVYSFDIENIGYTAIGLNTIILQDLLPGEVEFYNDEFDPSDAIITGPFEFEEITGVSGLTCCSGTGETDYSSSPGIVASFGYTPAIGYDPDVRHLKVLPSGEMAPQTSIAIRFRARIK